MKLSSKQTKFLRTMSQKISPIFQVGKGGASPHLVRHINEALERRELVKVSILNNSAEDPKELGQQLAQETESELVQVIGRTLVFYKESENYKSIELPNE